jgi:ribosomal protein L35AE/L33A
MNPALRRESRKETRRSVQGEVRVRFENPLRQEIQGRLVDVSVSGFRMAHEYIALEAGQMVEFAHVVAEGRARVVWNRIADARVETGFVVVTG